MFSKYKAGMIVMVSSTMFSMSVVSQEMSWSVETGIGFDSNVYHAPDHSYIDTVLPSTRPAGITVNPTEISSLFIPVKADAGVRNKIEKGKDFVAEIDFSSSLMLDSDADDATSTEVNVRMGIDYDLYGDRYSKKYKKNITRKNGSAYIGAFISTHNEVYVDRDSGVPKTTIGGVDVSDKYSYQSFGIAGDYERKMSGVNYIVGFELEDLNYDAPQSGAEYDHKLQKIRLGIMKDLSRDLDVRIAYDYSVRDYSDRHARSRATGDYLLANDLLKYTYNTLKLTMAYDAGRNLKTYFDIKNVNREDDFEGYNDSSRLDLALRMRYVYSDETRIRLKLKTSSTDYDNAFNFEDPTRGRKDSSALGVDAKVTHKINKNKTYYVEASYLDKESTDDRYDYTNYQFMLGSKWEY